MLRVMTYVVSFVLSCFCTAHAVYCRKGQDSEKHHVQHKIIPLTIHGNHPPLSCIPDHKAPELSAFAKFSQNHPTINYKLESVSQGHFYSEKRCFIANNME